MHIFPLLILSLVSFIWADEAVALFFAKHTAMNEVALGLTWLCLPIMHFSTASTLFLFSRFIGRLKAYTIPLFQYASSMGAIMFICGILKLTIARARPHLFLENGISGYAFGNFGNSFRSFPSSHTAVAVALAILVSQQISKKYKPLFWGFASVIALTRILLQMHFVSDILAGALIGQVVMLSVLSLTKRYEAKLNKILEAVL